jgi:hypothetical protein
VLLVLFGLASAPLSQPEQNAVDFVWEALITKNDSESLKHNPCIAKTLITKNHFQNFALAKIPEIPGSQRYQPG